MGLCSRPLALLKPIRCAEKSPESLDLGGRRAGSSGVRPFSSLRAPSSSCNSVAGFLPDPSSSSHARPRIAGNLTVHITSDTVTMWRLMGVNSHSRAGARRNRLRLAVGGWSGGTRIYCGDHAGHETRYPSAVRPPRPTLAVRLSGTNPSEPNGLKSLDMRALTAIRGKANPRGLSSAVSVDYDLQRASFSKKEGCWRLAGQ